jgi:uncharacterized membrane protein
MAEERDEPEQEIEVRLADSFRVEAFSDAVLAIAITLLVVELLSPEHEPGQLADALVDQWPAYVAYLASFGYLSVLWLNHHAVFTRVKYVDRGLKAWNIAVLFTTATLPFPTQLVSTALQAHNVADQRTAVAVYALLATLMCASWWALFHYLALRPRLVEDDVGPDFFEEGRVRALVGLALYVAGGLLGLLVTPWAALVVFALIPPFYAVTSEGLADSPLGRVNSRSRSTA